MNIYISTGLARAVLYVYAGIHRVMNSKENGLFRRKVHSECDGNNVLRVVGPDATFRTSRPEVIYA